VAGPHRRAGGRDSAVTDHVASKLGAATGKLYQRIQGLLTIATDLQIEPARAALARIVLDVLCGTYHDFRSGRPFPKGDLYDALGAVPPHPALDDQRAAVQAELLAGWYDEDDEEGRRWVAKLMPRKPGQPASDLRPETVELTPQEYRAFVWLYRYHEVYSRSPMAGEMATGLGIARNEVKEVLGLLERKGAAANLGGKRGWVPTRCP